MISHEFWQRKFAGDPDILGRTVGVWGGASVIVGVLPDGFRALMPPELNIGANPDIYRVMRSDLRASSREARYDRNAFFNFYIRNIS